MNGKNILASNIFSCIIVIVKKSETNLSETLKNLFRIFLIFEQISRFLTIKHSFFLKYTSFCNECNIIRGFSTFSIKFQLFLKIAMVDGIVC